MLFWGVISYVNVYVHGLVAVLQCAQVFLQFLAVVETEAVAEYHDVVGREGCAVVEVHEGDEAVGVKVVVGVDEVEVSPFR